MIHYNDERVPPYLLMSLGIEQPTVHGRASEDIVTASGKMIVLGMISVLTLSRLLKLTALSITNTFVNRSFARTFIREESSSGTVLPVHPNFGYY
jgi:hypothetical protein